MRPTVIEARPAPIRLTIGARTILSVRRRLHRVAYGIDALLVGGAADLPPLGDADGWLVTSLPAGRAPVAANAIRIERQRYARRYVDLTIGRDAWLAGLSANARAAIGRKLRRIEGRGMRVTAHHEPEAIAVFHAAARAISARTYQERLLDAGLPEGAGFVAWLTGEAEAGRLRAWLLHIGDRPAAYLCCPADGATLVYRWVGHDPDFASLSPGSVLLCEAIGALIDEDAFARFDFTEGDGQHKRQFATGSVDCVDLLLLRPTIANRALAAMLGGFDGAARLAKRAGFRRLFRPILR